MEEKDKTKVVEKAKYFYMLFNENLAFAGYSILLYQKRKIRDEMELFLTQES